MTLLNVMMDSLFLDNNGKIIQILKRLNSMNLQLFLSDLKNVPFLLQKIIQKTLKMNI
jgi:hypothetical protein